MSTDEADVLRAAAHLIERFAAHDGPGYFATFTPDATFIFHNSPQVLPSRTAYETLWQQWEREDGFRVLACRSFAQNVTILGDTAIFTHKTETHLAFGTTEQETIERESIIFQRQPGGTWLAVHEHLSPFNFA